jgi:hypothetical protein
MATQLDPVDEENAHHGLFWMGALIVVPAVVSGALTCAMWAGMALLGFDALREDD